MSSVIERESGNGYERDCLQSFSSKCLTITLHLYTVQKKKSITSFTNDQKFRKKIFFISPNFFRFIKEEHSHGSQMSARQHQHVESTCVVIADNDWSVLCVDVFS